MVGLVTLLKMLHSKRMNAASRLSSKTENPQKPAPGSTSQMLNIKTERNDFDCDQNICRVCLKEGEIPIYGTEDLGEELCMFTGLEISVDDAFPKYICSPCNALLQGAVMLRKTAQESDQLLRQPIQDLCTTSTLIDNNDDNHDYDSSEDTAFEYKETKTKIKLEQFDKVRRKTFTCRKCQLTFDTIEKYSEHRLSAEHDNVRKSCPICKKLYNPVYLKKHLKLHKPDSASICDICGKKFKVSGQLTRHRVTHFIDDLPFKCSVCPYRGRFSESLKLHMRVHTGEKPYQCPECPSRNFVNKSNLSKHLRTHRKDHDFTCSQCQRGFYSKRYLDLHYKVDHSGIKDHVCDLCGKAFGYRKQMMKHQLKVHKRDKLRSGRTPLYILLETKKQLEAEQS